MKYNSSVRENAFKTYLCTGSLSSTAVVCSLSEDTVRHWARQENWAGKLRTHREKIQRQILRDLYFRQIAGLKEFVKRFDYGSPGELTGFPIDDAGKNRRLEYGTNGLIFKGEKLQIEWFVRSLRQQPDYQCALDEGQTIFFAKTACTFGGFRFWFACPDCRRRCANLYKKKSWFSCRICQKLKYHKWSSGKKNTPQFFWVLVITSTTRSPEVLVGGVPCWSLDGISDYVLGLGFNLQALHFLLRLSVWRESICWYNYFFWWLNHEN